MFFCWKAGGFSLGCDAMDSKSKGQTDKTNLFNSWVVTKTFQKSITDKPFFEVAELNIQGYEQTNERLAAVTQQDDVHII